MAKAKTRHRKDAGGSISEDDFVADLMNVLNQTDEGCLTLGHILNIYPSFSTARAWEIITDSAESFVVDHPDREAAHLEAKAERVFVKAPIGLCSYHVAKVSKCNGDCDQLHVCRAFLLCSETACSFSAAPSAPQAKRGRRRQEAAKVCMFGHSFETPHNAKVLEQNGLSGFSPEDLRRLFRRRLSRTPLTLPKICFYYNETQKVDGGGCIKKCGALHICQAFVAGRCPGRCGLNHRMSTPGVRGVLEKFAMISGPDWDCEGKVLKTLRLELSKTHDHGKARAHSGGDSQSHDVTDLTQSDDGSDENADDSDDNGGFDDDVCVGCKDLRIVVERHEKTIAILRQHVGELQRMIKDLHQKES